MVFLRSNGYDWVFRKMLFEQNKVLLGIDDDLAPESEPVSVWQLNKLPANSAIGALRVE